MPDLISFDTVPRPMSTEEPRPTRMWARRAAARLIDRVMMPSARALELTRIESPERSTERRPWGRSWRRSDSPGLVVGPGFPGAVGPATEIVCWTAAELLPRSTTVRVTEYVPAVW